MKKILLLAALAATLTAQSASAVTDAEFKAKQDTLSMAMGKLCGAQFSSIASKDSTFNKQDFIAGFMQVMKADTTRTSYMDGLEMGAELYAQMKQMKQRDGIALDRNLVAQYLQSTLNGPALGQQQLMAVNNEARNSFIAVQAAVKQRLSQSNQEKGAAYIAKTLKSEKGWKKTASGLAIKMQAAGSGATFADTASVRLTYKGTHIDGSTFDESKDTIAMDLKHVVAGFKEALTLMRPGSKAVVIMPSSIAYGDNGAGFDQRTGKYAIAPGETLQFEINAIGLDTDKPAGVKTQNIKTPVGSATRVVPNKKGVRARSGKGTPGRGSQKK